MMSAPKAPGSKGKDKSEVDIFDGVKDKSAKFEYEAPDAFKYRKKPELSGGGGSKRVFKVPTVNGVDLEKMTSSSGPWNCEFCSYRNRSQDEICQKCYAESFKLRYQQFMNVVDGNNVQNEEDEQSEPVHSRNGTKHKKKSTVGTSREPKNAENDHRRKWQCSNCTFINTGDDDVCSMCGRVDEYRERIMDAKCGIFEEKKEATKDQKRADSPIISGNFVLREDKKGKKAKRMKMKAPKHKKEDETKLMKSAKYSESGQIANIHREWHANLWKQHKLKDPSRRAVPQRPNSQRPASFNGFKAHPSASEKRNKHKKLKQAAKSGNVQRHNIPNESAASNGKRRAPPAPHLNGMPQRPSVVHIDRQVIGAKSWRSGNAQCGMKGNNPWDGNTDNVRRDFPGGFVPHAHVKGKDEQMVGRKQSGNKRPNEKKGQNQKKGNGQKKKVSGKQNGSGNGKQSANRNPNKNRKGDGQKRKKKGNQRKQDTVEWVEEIKVDKDLDSSGEDEVDEVEDRMEWMEKMINMGFEADKAFEAIALSSDFNEALERLMQSIV